MKKIDLKTGKFYRCEYRLTGIDCKVLNLTAGATGIYNVSGGNRLAFSAVNGRVLTVSQAKWGQLAAGMEIFIHTTAADPDGPRTVKIAELDQDAGTITLVEDLDMPAEALANVGKWIGAAPELTRPEPAFAAGAYVFATGKHAVAVGRNVATAADESLLIGADGELPGTPEYEGAVAVAHGGKLALLVKHYEMRENAETGEPERVPSPSLTFSGAVIADEFRKADGTPIGGETGGENTAIGELGNSGAQTIDMAVTDKWGIAPTGAVELNFINFQELQCALLAITAGAKHIAFPGFVWDQNPSNSGLKLDGADIIKVWYSGGELFGELITKPPVTSPNNIFSSGDRTGIISYTSSSGLEDFGNRCINGLHAQSEGSFSNVSDVAGHWMQWDFGRKVLITKFLWDIEGSYGIWKIQGSNDGETWFDMQTTNQFVENPADTFTFDSNNASELTIHTITPFRYWRQTGVSGSAAYSGWVKEVEFDAGF